MAWSAPEQLDDWEAAADSEDDDDAEPLLRNSRPAARTSGSVGASKGKRSTRWLKKHGVSVGASVAIPIVCAVAWRSHAVTAFTWESWATIALTLEALLLMANNLPPDLVMLSVTVLLRVLGVITEEQAWRGFSSPGILAIGVLFVVAKCLEEAGTIELLAGCFLRRTSSPLLALMQLCVSVALVSSVVNDTPLVAMMIPIVLKWANDNAQPVSWFLLPLSYSALLGGVITLIGSSTNLVLADLMLNDKAQGRDPGYQLGFFSTTPVALPVALIGAVYMAAMAPALLDGHTTRPAAGVNGDNGETEELGREAQGQGGFGAVEDGMRRCYRVGFSVGGAAARQTPAALGLMRVPGARLCGVRCAIPDMVDADGATEADAGWAEMAQVEHRALQAGDVVHFLASPVSPPPLASASSLAPASLFAPASRLAHSRPSSCACERLHDGGIPRASLTSRNARQLELMTAPCLSTGPRSEPQVCSAALVVCRRPSRACAGCMACRRLRRASSCPSLAQNGGEDVWWRPC